MLVFALFLAGGLVAGGAGYVFGVAGGAGYVFGVAAGIAAWIVPGIASLVIYLQYWNDKPPLWYWPVIVALWPFVYTGGIIHPLR